MKDKDDALKDKILSAVQFQGRFSQLSRIKRYNCAVFYTEAQGAGPPMPHPKGGGRFGGVKQQFMHLILQ